MDNRKRWTFGSGDQAVRDRLVLELSISPLIAQLLANRGLRDREGAEAFLWPKLSALHDPDRLPDMEKAVRRIRQALEGGEKITIYGDYDVDGTTGTAVLLKFFELVGQPVESYIPHRVEEGYGLNLGAVEELQTGGTKLLITVDCGSRGHEAISYLQEAGTDVIVTDHHDLGEDVPPAYAVINPKMPESVYPFASLSGVGVAFKLAWALSQSFSNQKKVSPEFRDYLLMCLGFVALGTVADVVPLLDENRILTRYGLTALREAKSPGIRALAGVAGLTGRQLRASDVSFRLAPRLNAAGRMGHARETLELLVTQNAGRASELAQALEKQNGERKRLVDEVLEAARQQVEEYRYAKAPILVLAGHGWHPGVIGIVSARITEMYRRPSIIIGLEGDHGKGSARSIPAFHVTQALDACSDILLGHGGHSQAAGLQIKQGCIDPLRDRLVEYAGARLKPEDFVTALAVDAELFLTQVTEAFLRELEMLEPYGERNPEPMFVATGLTIAGEPRIMGKTGDHVSFYLQQGETSLRAVAFGKARPWAAHLHSGARCSIAFQPTLNEFRGRTSVELMIRDIRWEE